jgi:SAM-dependent methyltransferase
VSASERGARRAQELRTRYTVADLDVLTPEEARRFVDAGSENPQANAPLAWELLYRRDPDLYDRLVRVERLHPAVLRWLPESIDRIVEVGAGTGRLTGELLHRARELVAVEPAGPLRDVLNRRLASSDRGCRTQVTAGFFDDLPVPDDWADLVVACSAFTPETGHGGDAGLAEMERVCKSGGLVVIVWPNNVGWLAARGYGYVSFAGEMFVEFASRKEAAELIEIFYPRAPAEMRDGSRRRISYEALGINPPRDLAFKAKRA